MSCDSFTDEHQRFPLQGLSVLIIHPSAKACETYRKQLSAWGCDVVAVRNFEDALQALRYVGDKEWNLMVDGTAYHLNNNENIGAVLRRHGIIINRQMILSVLGSEDEYDIEDSKISVVARPAFREGIIIALSGSSKGTSTCNETVDVEKTVEKHVLLVEDNKTNQLVASAMLRKMGHNVDLAENGEEAVHKVQHKKYDIVFMDCQMPVLDGWQASTCIRQLGEGFRSLPIIALTANALAGDRDKCLAAGMNDYLSKPIKKQKLEDMMIQWTVHRH